MVQQKGVFLIRYSLQPPDPFLIAIAWSPFLCPQGFSTGLQIFRANDTASFFAPISNLVLGGTSNLLNTFSIGCPTLRFAQRRGKLSSSNQIKPWLVPVVGCSIRTTLQSVAK